MTRGPEDVGRQRERPPYPPLAVVAGVVAGVVGTLALARAPWAHVVRGLSDPVAVLLGWLPLGGFYLALALVLALSSSRQPRPLRGLQAAVLGAWAAFALMVVPGRYSSSALSDELATTGPAFERSLTAGGLLLVLGLLVMGLVLGMLGDRAWGRRLVRGSGAYVVLLVVPSVVVLVSLQLWSAL